MRTLRLIFAAAAFLTLAAACSTDPQIKSAKDLIERVTPGYSSQFKLELIPSDGDQDTYEIDSRGRRIILRGNNPVALATAYNQYLKYTCNAHVSWFGDQLDLPKRLPAPEKPVHNTINGQYRVCFNYCTLSYSAAWWDLKRWQKFYAMLQQHLDEGKPYVEEGLPQVYGRESFRANDFYSALGDWELQFVGTSGKTRTPIAQGDDLETVRELYSKYVKLSEDYN